MQHWTDRLSEYLDDTLAATERRAAEEHLAVCAECASTLVDLRTVVDRAQTLESRAPEIPGHTFAGFSHQIHAGKLGMDCRYCHSQIENSPEANMPILRPAYSVK